MEVKNTILNKDFEKDEHKIDKYVANSILEFKSGIRNFLEKHLQIHFSQSKAKSKINRQVLSKIRQRARSIISPCHFISFPSISIQYHLNYSDSIKTKHVEKSANNSYMTSRKKRRILPIYPSKILNDIEYEDKCREIKSMKTKILNFGIKRNSHFLNALQISNQSHNLKKIDDISNEFQGNKIKNYVRS